MNTLKEGQESGRFVALNDPHLRTALLVEFARVERRRALIGRRSLAADPQEVAEAIPTEYPVIGRLSFEIATRHREPVLPPNHVRVPAVELAQRRSLVLRYQFVVDDVPHFHALSRYLHTISFIIQSYLSSIYHEIIFIINSSRNYIYYQFIIKLYL